MSWVQCTQLLDAARTASGSPVVGHLPKDKHTGKLIDVWTSAMTESGLTQVDINNGVADLLACKDANEVGLLTWPRVSCVGNTMLAQRGLGKLFAASTARCAHC